MARRGPKKRASAQPSPEPESLRARELEYLDRLRVQNYSEATLRNHRHNLGYFLTWCEERGVSRPSEVTRNVLTRYQKWLYDYRSEDGRPLSFRSQNVRLSPIRGLFRWLSKNNLILFNPAADLELPRMEKRLPKDILSISEVDRLMNAPEATDLLGLRDRAILETLYSTGIRRQELVNLKLFDLDIERGTLFVRQGKGKKDRLIPIGERAQLWIEKYLADVRPKLVMEPDEATLFLSIDGEAISPKTLSGIVSGYMEGSGIGKRGSCHLLRHTMATHMLEGGADIRFIQQMLGHAEISSTEKYTRVAIRKLKEVHTQTHPSARIPWKTHPASKLAQGPEASAGSEQLGRDILLSALAAEGFEEDDPE